MVSNASHQQWYEGGHPLQTAAQGPFRPATALRPLGYLHTITKTRCSEPLDFAQWWYTRSPNLLCLYSEPPLYVSQRHSHPPAHTA